MPDLKLIATKIMGWKDHGNLWWCPECLGLVAPKDVTFQQRHTVCGQFVKPERTFDPLTNPADAWELESALAIRIGSCEAIYTQWNDGAWKIGIVGCDWYLDGDTRENAVCKLAEKLAKESK